MWHTWVYIYTTYTHNFIYTTYTLHTWVWHTWVYIYTTYTHIHIILYTLHIHYIHGCTAHRTSTLLIHMHTTYMGVAYMGAHVHYIYTYTHNFIYTTYTLHTWVYCTSNKHTPDTYAHYIHGCGHGIGSNWYQRCQQKTLARKVRVSDDPGYPHVR